MIDRNAIEQIIAQYTRHGWKLRRVLLSDAARSKIGDTDMVFGSAAVFASDLDALWFSRSSNADMAAWELRHLDAVPYALVTGVPDGSDASESEAILGETEAKMREVLVHRET